MEKQGIVDSRHTNDVEQRVGKSEKRAGQQATSAALDDDFTKRAADKASNELKNKR